MADLSSSTIIGGVRIDRIRELCALSAPTHKIPGEGAFRRVGGLARDFALSANQDHRKNLRAFVGGCRRDAAMADLGRGEPLLPPIGPLVFAPGVPSLPRVGRRQ